MRERVAQNELNTEKKGGGARRQACRLHSVNRNGEKERCHEIGKRKK